MCWYASAPVLVGACSVVCRILNIYACLSAYAQRITHRKSTHIHNRTHASSIISHNRCMYVYTRTRIHICMYTSNNPSACIHGKIHTLSYDYTLVPTPTRMCQCVCMDYVWVMIGINTGVCMSRVCVCTSMSVYAVFCCCCARYWFACVFAARMHICRHVFFR